MFEKESDAALIGRAHHAGRNLRALAYLFLLLFFLPEMFLAMAAKDPRAWLFPLTFLFLIIGYWLLSTAAKKGDPVAPVSAVLFMVLFWAANIVNFKYFRSMDTDKELFKTCWFVIPIIIMVLLTVNWNELKELRKRGLHEQAFGPVRKSCRFCQVGMVLLVCSFLALVAGINMENSRTREIQHAKAFLGIINYEERAFLNAMAQQSRGFTKANVATVQEKLTDLENQLEVLQKTTPPNNQAFLEVLASYEAAVRQWRKGVEMMQVPDADKPVMAEAIEKGNRLRMEACEKFKSHYVDKNGQ